MTLAYRFAQHAPQIGPERIRTALLERGVPAEDVEEALSELGGEQEIELAVTLLRDRGGALEDGSERQRALGMLIRRGYDSEVAYEAIRRLRSD